MSTKTASLERSLQNCSLNQPTGAGEEGRRRSKPCIDNNDETAPNAPSSSNSSNTYVDLNSHVSLPYHWEQCLDLKTGELYYINWSNMMKVREDPRTTTGGYNGDYDSDEDEEDDEDEDDEDNSIGYNSEESSTGSYRCPSENLRSSLKKVLIGGSERRKNEEELREESVLVVAGCKSCLMYHMVPKHLEFCPKCSGQLLHFPPNPAS